MLKEKEMNGEKTGEEIYVERKIKNSEDPSFTYSPPPAAHQTLRAAG